VAGGYFGQALVIDVAGDAAGASLLELDERVLRSYLGGVGLGTWLLHRLAPPRVDPRTPDAPLAFVFSPLVGTPLTTSAKFAVVAKSPLTGLLTDALASSQFAISGKLTGNDAIVVRGRATELSVLLVDATGVRLEPAAELAGMPAARAEEALRARFGRGWRTAAIGPAGERGVAFATISHDGRHAGRGGLGAVLGAKNLKAVLVRAGARVDVADPVAVLAAAKDLRARSFGPATAKYRELGTLANLLAFNAVSTLPTRNFTAATFEGAPKLAAEELHELRGVARSSCASCSIGCEHIYSRKGGGSQRMEYENVFALGPLCGVSDPDDVFAASARCDELGVDTISAGGTIAWRWSAPSVGWSTLRGCGSATGPRCCGRWTCSARGSRGSASCWRSARGRRPRSSDRGRRRSRRTSRAWSCPATNRGRCRRWRSGWPSTRGGRTTTAPGRTRPTCPVSWIGWPGGRRTWPPRSAPRTGPRCWTP